MSKNEYLEPLDNRKARFTARDCVCSTCWKHLNLHPAPDRMYYVKCSQCGDDTRGYTRKETVERMKHDDHFNALDVAKAYPELKKASKKKSADESINELGF